MNHKEAWRLKKYQLQLWLFGSAMLALIPLWLSFTRYLAVPNWITLAVIIYVSVATTLTIADLLVDFLSRRKTVGTILTFILSLYVLPLVAVGLAESILGKAAMPIGKLVLYLMGYSINIIYCLLHRDVVESKMSEFKAALYISAGIYILALAILTILAPAVVDGTNTTRIAAVFVSFTMCRGIVEVFSIQLNEKKFSKE
ncbi:MAG: hypothetical protein ABSB32_05460 [Thermodesulfobacteriota bacterium]|jgi:hypothetical protein